MQNNISLLVGLKNNLEYSKNCYQYLRQNSLDVEIVFVSYGSTDGTNEWLQLIDDDNFICFFSSEEKTLSDTYNKAIDIATKDYVCFLHNDMVIGKNFLEEILESLLKHKIVYYKVIEPPIFAEDKRLWKEVRDFGDDFTSFRSHDFFQFEANQKRKEFTSTEDVSFFLAAKRNVLKEIKGLDPLFKPMFCEDDDLILRLKMYGEKTFVAANALVYHFVSKTSRFSSEFKNRTKKIEENSLRNFFRKWGFHGQSKSKKKLGYGLILKNPTTDSIKQLEIFVDHIYSDFNPEQYIKEEQKNTLFDLGKKFKSINDGFTDDIMIKFDSKKMSEKNLYIFKNLADIIIEKKQTKINILQKILSKPNQYRSNDLRIEIMREASYEQQLIIRDNA